MSEKLEPVNCPICGAKAFVQHFVVDGFGFGWGAGCPRFRLNDKYHHIPDGTPEAMWPRVLDRSTKQEAIKDWNEKAEAITRARKVHAELDNYNWHNESLNG